MADSQKEGGGSSSATSPRGGRRWKTLLGKRLPGTGVGDAEKRLGR